MWGYQESWISSCEGHDPFNSPIVAFVFPLLDLGFLSSCTINIISTGMTLNKAMSFHGITATAQDGTLTSNGSDFTVKAALAQRLKGGVIMDVVNAEGILMHLSDRSHVDPVLAQARIAEEAGACAVMALERRPR